MIRKLFYAFLVLLLVGTTSCNSSSNKHEKKATLPEIKQEQYYKRFEGKINEKKVVLHLIKYHSSVHKSMDNHFIQYRGTFIANKDSSPLTISGYRKNDTMVALIAYEQFSPVDTLIGKFSGNIFQGKLLDEQGSSSLFKLKTNYPKGSFHWSVYTETDSVKVDTVEGNFHPKAVADLMTLWPEKDMPSSGRRLFKDTVSYAFYGRKQSFSSAEKLLKSASDTFFVKYKDAVRKMLQHFKELRPTLNWTYLAYMKMTCNAGNRMSGIFTEYKYLGGAHGLQNEFGYAIDLKTGKPLQLSDIFKTGYQEELQKVLEKRFRQQYDVPEGEALNGKNGLLFEDHLKVSSNFYLTPYGIGFIYNPYEVAPYVVGIIDLYVPFNDLQRLLKD